MDLATLGYEIDPRGLREGVSGLKSLTAEAAKAERGSERLERQWAETTKRMAKIGLVTGAVAGLAAATYGLTKLRNAYGDVVDTIDRAEKLGWGTDQLSRVEFAARASGVEVNALSTGMQGLTRFMVGAAKGSKEQAGILKQLGIEAKQADGSLRSTLDVMKDLADVFPRLTSPTDRAALAIKVFGQNGADLLPMFEDGAAGIERLTEKSDKLGYTLTNETSAGAKEVKKQMDLLKLSMDGLWRQSLTQLLPKLEGLAGLLNSQDFRDGFSTIINGATTAVGALARFATTTASVTKFLGEEVAARVHGSSFDDIVRMEQEADRIRGQLKFVSDNPISGAAGNWMRDVVGLPTSDELQGRLSVLEREISSFYDNTSKAAQRAAKIAEDAGAPIPGLTLDWDFSSGDGGGNGGGNRRQRELPDFSRKAEEEMHRQMKVVELARQQFDAMAATLAGPLAQANHQYAVDLERLNNLAKVGEISFDELAAAQSNLRNEHEQTTRAIERMLDPLGSLADDIAFENSLMRMGNVERQIAIATRGMEADAIKEQAASIGKLRDELQRAEEMDGVVQAMDALRDAGSDFLYDMATGAKGFKDSMSDALDSLHKQLTRMVTDRLMEQLLGSFGSAGGGAYGDAAAGILGALFGGGRAWGGNVRANRMYRVGERDKPEILNLGRGQQYLIPGDHGRVEPVQGGNEEKRFQVNQTIQIAGKVDNRTAGQIAREAERAMRRAARLS